MKKILLFAALLSLAGVVGSAPNAGFSAQAPTTYVDGTTIPASDSISYRVYCSRDGGQNFAYTYDTPTLAPGTQIDVASCVQGTPGTYYFFARAISSVYGTESLPSQESSIAYTAEELGKVPNPPTLFIVQ